MESNTENKPVTVRIEIEISKYTDDFIKAYSKLAQKTPEVLFKKVLMTGIRDIMGTIGHLPHMNLEKFKEVMACVPDDGLPHKLVVLPEVVAAIPDISENDMDKV